MCRIAEPDDCEVNMTPSGNKSGADGTDFDGDGEISLENIQNVSILCVSLSLSCRSDPAFYCIRRQLVLIP